MMSRAFISDIEKRKKQIDTLKIFNDNVIEIKENEEYRVEFKSGGRHMSLCVLLGPGFPVEKPRLVIRPTVQHSWVQQMTGEVVDAPGLLNFTVHSDLGRVVQAIIREFERNPPSPVESGVFVQDKILNQEKVEIDNDKDALSNRLAQLSTKELRNLMNDDEIDEYLLANEQVQQQSRDLDEMMGRVESLANVSIEKQTELDTLKQSIITDLELFTRLRQNCETLNDRYQQMSDRYSPQNICELLQKSAANCDRNCDEIAEKFLNGDCGIDLFIQEFMNARKLSHSRKAKEERLQMQLNALERAGF